MENKDESCPTLVESIQNVELNASEDEDYLAPNTQELEDADNSSSDSENGSLAEEVDEEDFEVQIKDGEILKLKFQQLEISSQVGSIYLEYIIY